METGKTESKLPELPIRIDQAEIMQSQASENPSDAKKTGSEEHGRLAEIRRRLGNRILVTPPTTHQSFTNTGRKKLAGFREKPLKVLRNFFAYPDLPKTLAISGSILTVSLATTFFEPSFLSKGVALACIPLASAELISYLLRTRKLSRHLNIRTVRPDHERILADGTRINLDSNIGEFHLANLLSLAFTRNKRKRTLAIKESLLQGMVDLAEKVENNDPAYKDFVAFKGTSTIIPPAVASRLGFEVGKLEGLTATIYPIAIILDKVLSASPLGTKDVYVVWISKQGLVRNKGKFQQELARMKAAVNRSA